MQIAESNDGARALEALRHAQRDACELFVEPRTLLHLALLADITLPDPAWTCMPVELLFARGRYGPGAGRWLLRVGLWVPTPQRREFLEWYEQEHLPILLECATWDGCRFVEAPDSRGCQFFALHQVADEAALSSSARARSRATAWFRRLARFEWFDEPFTRTLFCRVEADAW